MSWQIALYAVLSLTVVRMVPVAISLWGTHARAPTAPLVSRYATWYHADAGKSPPAMESQQAHEHRARGSALLTS